MTTATATPIKLRGMDIWAAPSASRERLTHLVRRLDDGTYVCSCESFTYRRRCRHIVAVQQSGQEVAPVTEEKPTWQPYARPADAELLSCGHERALRDGKPGGCAATVWKPGVGMIPCDGRPVGPEQEPEKPDEYGGVSNCPRCGSERMAFELGLPLGCLACEGAAERQRWAS